MQNYKTVEEKAAEWNISPRQVQNLCRKGVVEGAIKRVGAWFIPDDVPIPTKNTKSDAHPFEFVGTRKIIFDSAIELFTLHGYENVSIKDIADKVGIRQSTIYNHFKSKQDILDTIYNYYCHYYLADRPSLEDMEPVLRDGSLMDIIKRIRYSFKEDYEQRMSDITKIVFRRNAIDDRAREIAQSLTVKEGINYVEAVFNRAIEIGRLAAFDTHAMAVFINSIGIFRLYNWIMDPSPENAIKLTEDEHTLYQYAITLITDLNPPAN